MSGATDTTKASGRGRVALAVAAVIAVLAAAAVVVVRVLPGDEGSATDPATGFSGPGTVVPPPGLEARDVTFDVSWNPDAVRIPADVVAASLVDLSDDETRWTFHDPADAIAALTVGTPLVLEGYTVATVTGVDTADDGDLVLTLTPADLTDVIDEGTIEFTVDVTYDDARVGYRERPVPLEGAGPSVPLEGSDVDTTANGDPTGQVPVDGAPSVQPAGPDMTTTTVPPQPATSTNVQPVAPDETVPTTVPPAGGTDPTGAAGAAGGFGRSRPPADAGIAQAPDDPAPDDPAPDDPAPDEPPDPEGDPPAPVPPNGKSFVHACDAGSCKIYGAAGSFDFFLATDHTDQGALHLALDAALRSESLGQIYVKGEATVGNFTGTARIKMANGQYTEFAFTPADMTAQGLFDWSAKLDPKAIGGLFMPVLTKKATDAFKKATKTSFSGDAKKIEQDLAKKDYNAALDEYRDFVGTADLQPVQVKNEFEFLGSKKDMTVLAGSEVVRLPLEISVPVIIAGLPFVISWAADFAVTPALTGNTSTASGTLDFTFSAANGTELLATGAKALGKNALEAVVKEGPFLIQGLGADGMAVNVGLRASLGIGVFMAQAKAGVGGVAAVTQISPGTLGIAPCSRTDWSMDLTASTGVSFVGLDLKRASVILLTKKGGFVNPPGVGCS